MKLALLIIAMGMVGCTSMRFCGINDSNNCRPWTPGEQSGPVTRGYYESENTTK